jgi:NAD(P) transhydrogenase
LADGTTVSFRQHEAIQADVALMCIGRTSNVDGLRLEHVGVQLGDRSCIVVDEHYRTTVDNIYAAGDVIGPPALASTSTEQGATAISHMFGQDSGRKHQVIPTGIYTIPEVAMIGESEETAASRRIAYEVGRAPYRTNARAAILGDTTGLLKLIFSRDTHVLVGVHVIGELATELVHIGQCYLALGGTLETLGDTVFNFPTLSELYKVAAEDGLRRAAKR